LTICIPVHGSSLALEKALESIERYVRTYCVDNQIECSLLIANSKGDDICVERYWHGNYKVISIPPSYYWSGAVKSLFIASQQTDPSHILLMNHDITLMPDSFTELIKVIQENPNSVLSSVSVVMGTSIVENAGFQYTNRSLPFCDLYADESHDKLPKQTYNVDALNGRFILLPASSADPNFLLPFLVPHYFADTVLSTKIRRSGFLLTIVPSSIILSDQSDTEFKLFRNRCNSMKGLYNCLLKPYSYRYVWGNLWGQFLLVDNPILGIIASLKYTSLRIGKSVFELVRIIEPL
jgi:GT2 family glycosyltransferase